MSIPVGRLTLLASLAWMGGCGGGVSDFSGPSDPASGSPMAPGLSFGSFVQIDVRASNAFGTGEALSDGLRVLPQSHLPAEVFGPTVAVDEINLKTPLELTGTVFGYALNPLIALFPGEDVVVPGTVYIAKANTVQSYVSRTDEVGAFQSWIVPLDIYRLTMVPDDPSLPMYTQELPVAETSSPVDLEIGAGVPVYGSVRSTVGPVIGSQVHLVDASGIRSATAVTDDNGRYTIRTHPGIYTVVCEGRDAGQDPIWRQSDVEVTDLGALVDFNYPTDLTLEFAEGRIVSTTGDNLSGSVVRLIAEQLDGYPANLDVSWSWDAPASADFNKFFARVVPGIYTVEVLPPQVEVSPSSPDAEAGFSPVRLANIPIGQSSKLGDIVVEPTLTVDGSVTSDNGPLAGATIDCMEIGYDERSWATATDASGTYTMELPRVPLSCRIGPPPDASAQLAQARLRFDPLSDDPDFELGPGVQFNGRITGPDGPEAYATIEIRELGGELMAYGLSDDQGRYSIRAELTPPEEPTTP